MFGSSRSPDSAIRTEDSLPVAAILAASGGFLDGYTYLGHGHVFANAMTGNVVILGISAATAHWSEALAHVYPIAAFLAGVGTAQVFQLSRVQKRIPRAPIAALAVEILFLGIAGWFAPDLAGTVLVPGISFVAAVQSSTFKRAGKWSYNSTMTTGSLRVLAESLFQRFFGKEDESAGDRIRIFGTLCAAFLAGAVAGGLSTAAFQDHALWIVDVLLSGLWLWLVADSRGR